MDKKNTEEQPNQKRGFPLPIPTPLVNPNTTPKPYEHRPLTNSKLPHTYPITPNPSTQQQPTPSYPITSNPSKQPPSIPSPPFSNSSTQQPIPFHPLSNPPIAPHPIPPPYPPVNPEMEQLQRMPPWRPSLPTKPQEPTKPQDFATLSISMQTSMSKSPIVSSPQIPGGYAQPKKQDDVEFLERKTTKRMVPNPNMPTSYPINTLPAEPPSAIPIPPPLPKGFSSTQRRMPISQQATMNMAPNEYLDQAQFAIAPSQMAPELTPQQSTLSMDPNEYQAIAQAQGVMAQAIMPPGLPQQATVNMSPNEYLDQAQVAMAQSKIAPGLPQVQQATLSIPPNAYLDQAQPKIAPGSPQAQQATLSLPPSAYPEPVSVPLGQAKTLNMAPDEYRPQSQVPIGQAQTVNMDFSSPHEELQVKTGPSASTPAPQNPLASPAAENKPVSLPSRKDPLSLLGTLLIGKYKITKFLGQGGMGAVYLAEHKILGERAIKFLVKTDELNPTMLSRFINEAKAASRVQHQNVVQVYDIDETPQFHFIVMEFVKGKGLDTCLEAGPLPCKEAVTIMKPIAEGLAAIHAANMVHRDIKPSNIMLAESGIPKIMDFGIVKDIGKNTALTGTGTIIGTPQFMSPEQIQCQPIDARSDIYSLGATFYYLLTKQLCFTGSVMQLMYQILNTEPIPPHEINADISVPLSQIILKMMAKSTKNRYQDMNQVVTVLSNYEKNIGQKK